MYDPIKLSENIERLVLDKNKKKYYRFRPTRFYGGISTADTVGCNLRCKFCWSKNSVWNPNKTGKFYSPKEVSDKIQSIAQKKGYQRLRISGGEPTIGKKHLIELLENIDKKYLFILETNGILLGYDKSYVEKLSTFDNIHIRVCMKGADKGEFSLFTGAKDGFNYLMRSLEHLDDKKVSFNIALVSNDPNKKQLFFQKLSEMGLEKIMVEEEKIKLYPQVRKKLEKEGLLDYFK